jgi:hypothetical protein
MLAENEVSRTAWLARSVLAGFCATLLMIVVYFFAYGMALPMAHIPLANASGAFGTGNALQTYFAHLIDNPLVNFARNELYAALALHFVVGIGLAVLYAFVEPHLSGRGWWRGVKFSFIPYILSLVVFLPLVGAGFFGLALGAGLLPVFGNLVLHLAYGATLGAVYSPGNDYLLEAVGSPDRVAAELRALRRAEGGAMTGLVVGLVAGLVMGIAVLLGAHVAHIYRILGLPDAYYLLATTLGGGCLGALVGSLATLPTGVESQPGIMGSTTTAVP